MLIVIIVKPEVVLESLFLSSEEVSVAKYFAIFISKAKKLKYTNLRNKIFYILVFTTKQQQTYNFIIQGNNEIQITKRVDTYMICRYIFLLSCTKSCNSILCLTIMMMGINWDVNKLSSVMARVASMRVFAMLSFIKYLEACNLIQKENWWRSSSAQISFTISDESKNLMQ